MAYDPNYKIKHRVTSPKRLLRYEHFPPPFVGDPPGWQGWRSWKDRGLALYGQAMEAKRKCGLWMWLETN